MRLKQLIALPLLGVLLTGCFDLRPVEPATPKIGSNVALELNDAGRNALAPTMGPAIDRIEGRLLQRDSSEYIVAVSGVQFLRGDSQSWGGASSRVQSNFVNKYYSVQFSPVRTAILGAALVAGGVFIVEQFFVPSQGTSEGTNPEGPPPVNRIPRGGVRIPLQPVKTVHLVQRLLPYLLKH